MKKNILALAVIAIVAIIIWKNVNIQSVDEFYENEVPLDNHSGTVTITIRCDTILDNYDDLDKSLQSEEFVPADGVILPETAYEIQEGDTVFDILLLAVKDQEMQLEYQGGDENIFGTVYIQGINHLYEYSCGPLSGWTYRVNGETPKVGCSQYVLADGDAIEWLYTFDLGHDI